MEIDGQPSVLRRLGRGGGGERGTGVEDGAAGATG
jgi:hypothetical protein